MANKLVHGQALDNKLSESLLFEPRYRGSFFCAKLKSMKKITCEFFPCWSYPDALAWMNTACKRVAYDQDLIVIGYGTHATKLVTLGRSHSQEDFDSYSRIFGSALYLTDRGGGPTAHEPGQLVLYPVLNLNTHKLSVRDLVRAAEQAMLSFMASLGVEGCLSERSHGVFVGTSKIGFIGMRIKNNISSHGLAINLFNDANIFKTFTPCNINNLPVGTLCEHIRLPEALSFYGEKLCEAFINNLLIRNWKL